jgi:hypothetical protein
MNSDDDKELKQLWSKYSEATSPCRLNQKEIADMVEQVIARPFKKMRLGLLLDITCSITVCTWFTYIGLQNLRNWPLLLTMTLIIAGCIYALCARFQTLRRLKRVSRQTPEMILQTLRKSIEKMDRQNRKNAVRVFLMVVFCLGASFLSLIYFSRQPYFNVLGGSNSAAFWGVAFSIVSGIAAAYGYAKWYRRHFYQKPMERMQTAIREIEQEN